MNKKIKVSLLSLLVVIVMLALSLSLFACDKVSELTGVKYDKETKTVTWDKAAAAETYNVVVDGVKSLTTTETSAEVVVDESEGKDVAIAIEAVGQDGNLVATGNVELFVLPLMTVEVKDYRFDWTSSAATINRDGKEVAYQLVLDGEQQEQLVTDTFYDAGAGAHTLKVKAVYTNTENYFSNYSLEAKTSVLSMPANIQFDNEMLSWGAVDFLDGEVNYTLTINDETYENIGYNYANLEELGIDISEVLSISVQAVSKKETVKSSQSSSTITYKKVKQIESLYIESGILKWSAIDKADGYSVEINGKEAVQVTTNEYDGLVPGESYSIRVRALASGGAFTYGSWSESIEACILNTPNVRFLDEEAYWDNIVNSEGYQIVINKVDRNGKFLAKTYDETLKSIIFNVADVCTEVGIYNFQVRAKAPENSDYYESKLSTVKTVVKLGKPTKLTVEESSSASRASAIHFTINDVSEGANYVMEIEGTEVSATNGVLFSLPKPIASYVSQTEGKANMNVTIKAVPKTLAERNGKIYLPANEGDVLEFTLSQLAIPENVSLTTAGDKLTWEENATVKAIGGTYGIFLGSSYVASTNEYLLPELTVGIYNLQIFARAASMKEQLAGENDIISNSTYTYDPNNPLTIYLSSDLSPTITMKKLEKISDFRMENESFTWNQSPGAIGYRVDLVTQNESAVQYTYGAPEQNTYTEGTKDFAGNDRFAYMYTTYSADISPDLDFNTTTIVQVKAMGNAGITLKGYETIILDSDYATITRENIVSKLAKPTGLKFEGETLSWNSIPNSVSYGVYLVIGNSYTLLAIEDATSSSLADYGAYGYSFVVQAYGDGKNYIHSDYSDVLSFTKLRSILEPQLKFSAQDSYYYWAYEEGVTGYKIIVSSTSGDTIESDIDREDIELAKSNFMCSCGYKLDKNEHSALPTENWTCPDCESGVEELILGVEYTPNFQQKNNPLITIYALGDNKEYMNSQKVTFIQRTVRLSAPVDPNVVCKVNYDGGVKQLIFTSSIKNPLTNGGYTFNVAGINYNVDGEDAVLVYNKTASGTYNVSVGYRGNGFQKVGSSPETAELVYYYNSGVSITATKITCLNDVNMNRANMSIFPVPPNDANSKDKTVKFSIGWTPIDTAQYCCYYEIYSREQYDTYLENGGELEVKASGEKKYVGMDFSYSAEISYNDYFKKGYCLVFYVKTVGDEDANGFGTIISSNKYMASQPMDLIGGQ